jgi:hypothetical protein
MGSGTAQRGRAGTASNAGIVSRVAARSSIRPARVAAAGRMGERVYEATTPPPPLLPPPPPLDGHEPRKPMVCGWE